jgi:hypothetical protein
LSCVDAAALHRLTKLCSIVTNAPDHRGDGHDDLSHRKAVPLAGLRQIFSDRRIRNPQVALSKGICARGFTMPDKSEASRFGAGSSRRQALARWHQDRWFKAKLSRPPRVTLVIKRKELAAGFAGSKVQRVGKVDSLPTMT